MMRKAHVVVITALIMCIFSNAHAVGVTARFGMGLLWDERASDGILGGGQLALEMRLNTIPLAFQLANEYWSKGCLEHPYEIESFYAAKVLLVGNIGGMMSCLYTKPVVPKTAYVYLGGGIGLISVPQIDDPDARETGMAFDAVCGANIGLFWKTGLFVEGKYLYSSKTTNNIEVIDFSDFGCLAGISLNFDL